jgi:signal transduction histidine kinase
VPLRRLRPGALPLTPFAPAIVVIVGVAVAVALGFFGLVALRRASDAGALEQARVLAGAMAARVRVVPNEDREAVVEHAARATATDAMLVDQIGRVVVDTSVDAAPETPVAEMLVVGEGFVQSSTGRVAYAAQPLEAPLAHLSLIVFVHAPPAPPGSRELLRAVGVLAAILVGIAAYAAYRFSRSAYEDVAFVTRRVVAMASARRDPVGNPVPIRSLDQVGVVTSAFNSLLERFAAAERAYEHDLAQADTLDKARARFLATLSHELRTPLNAILGFADVLLSEVDGPLTASAREDLEVIRSSGEHLKTLIDDVLDLSAMVVGNLRLDRRPVDVVPIAETVVREAQPLLEGRPVHLTLAGDEHAIAFADARRVRQILANLVGNAAKFTREGRIDVVVTAIWPSIVIEVRDTGPGIAEGERAGIFEEYRQVGDLAARRKGTGLGLAIARRLTDAHDGKLSLESELGKGSTFRVELPREARPSSRPPPPSRRSTPPRAQ